MDTLTIVIAVVISLAVGFFTGRVLGSARGDTNTSRLDKLPDPENLIVERDTRTHKISVRLGGRSFYGKGTLTSQVKDELKELIREMRGWLGEPADAAPAQTLPKSRLTAAGARIKGADDFDNVEEEVKGLNISDVLTKALRSDIKSPDLAPKSVAAQVDAILQEKIAGTHLSARGIRLMEFPNQGMVVLIGLDKYSEVDDVPDAEVRMVIKEAVSTWEDRMLNKD